MRRFHLIEFEDYKWFPNAVRDGITDYLRFFVSLFDLYKPVVPYLKEMLEKSGSDRIIELGAGGGGGIEKVLNHLDKITSGKTTVVLTDYFPNVDAFELVKRRSGGRIDFFPEPVDASNVPENLTGARTLFSAFHHFEPETAKAVLRDAVTKNSPIGVFDGAERKMRYIFAVICSTLLFIFLISFLYIFALKSIFGIEAPPSKIDELVANRNISSNILIIVTAVVAPFCEEIYFRGFLYPAFKKNFGVLVALFLSSFLFSLAHLELYSFIPIMVIGWLLAYIYEKTKSIFPVIFLHAMYNLILISILLGKINFLKLY